MVFEEEGAVLTLEMGKVLKEEGVATIKMWPATTGC